MLKPGGNESDLVGDDWMEMNRVEIGWDQVKYAMEVDGDGKAWVMRSQAMKGLNEIQVLRYDPQSVDKSHRVQSFVLDSSPSPSSSSNSSLLFYPHSVHLNSNDEPVFIYSRVSQDDGFEGGEKEHRVVLATCGEKDCGQKLKKVELVFRKKGAEEIKPMLSSAVDKKEGQIFLAVAESPSSDHFSIFSCSSSSCTVFLTGGSLLSSDSDSSSRVKLHSLQIRVEASTCSPVVLYSKTTTPIRGGGEAKAEAKDYSIGLMRDGIDEVIVSGKGDLRSLSFVLDPETEYPIILASATLSDSVDSQHTIIRSCSSLYCDQDDTITWMVTLPKTVTGMSGLELDEKSTHGQLMMMGKVNGQNGQVIIRVDVLRHFNRHLVNEKTEDESEY
jgi:hypothetical protein